MKLADWGDVAGQLGIDDVLDTHPYTGCTVDETEGAGEQEFLVDLMAGMITPFREGTVMDTTKARGWLARYASVTPRAIWTIMDMSCTMLLAMGGFALTTSSAAADVIGCGAITLALGLWSATSRERLAEAAGEIETSR